MHPALGSFEASLDKLLARYSTREPAVIIDFLQRSTQCVLGETAKPGSMP